MSPRISIALATRNGAKYIREQLRSIEQQELRPDEIVICDDRSTDGTIEEVGEFSARSPVRVILEVNASPLGVTRNFEKALLRCSGDILFLCDQDDIWMPEKIACVVDHFNRDESLMVVTNDQIIGNDDLTLLGPRKTANMAKLGLRASDMCTGCCTALRREFLELAAPFCSGWSHDNWIGSLASVLGVKGFVDRPLQLYRRHDANASHWLASSRGPIGIFDRFDLKSAEKMASAWERRLMINTWKTTRLLERRAWLSRHNLTRQAADALQQLDQQRTDVERRLEIARSKYPRRVGLVLRCLSEGGYASFGGLRSMLADLARHS